jgi:acyl carrier protein
MVTKQAVYDEVVKILRNELVFDGALAADLPIQALGLDSIRLMQLFVYLEEAFNFEFTVDAPIATIKEATLDQFVSFVHHSIGQAA